MAGVKPLQPEVTEPPDAESRKLLDHLRKEFALAEAARAPYEAIWILNLAFYEGEQWLLWDGNRLSQPKLSKTRIKITDNRITPAVRTEIAKMTKQRPSWDATPDDSSDEAVDGAKFLERVIDNKWDTMSLTARLRRALEWSRVCSAGFWKVAWDSSLGKGREVVVGQDGKVVRHPETQEPLDPELLSQLPEEARAQIGRAQHVFQGDGRIDVRSPFQIYPDPLAEGMDECEHIFERSVQSPRYIKGRYGVDMLPNAATSVGLVQARMASPGSQKTGRDDKRGIEVFEYWEKASAANPKGRHVVWAQDKILLDEANPYVDSEGNSILPYVMFVGIDVPGRFWPTCIVEQLRPLQVELNKVKSQIAENRNRIGNPSLLVSKQARVKYAGVPGERVEYDDTTQNAVPSFLQPPEMPGYVQNEIASMQEAIQEISGQHEISSGMVPQGVTAAAAINLLQEADDTKLGPPIDDMETAISRAGQMLARLIGEYYTEDRLVAIAGEDGAFEAFQFKGAMLNGQDRLRVTPGSMRPRSKAAKQALMQDNFNLMIQYGIRFDERALRKYFREYEVGGLEALLGDLGKDEQQINRENRKMMQGGLIDLPVNPIVDNHSAHIAGHREFMKTTEWEKADKAVQAVFLVHLKHHMDEEQQQMLQQLMPPPGMEGGAEGAPGSPQTSPGGGMLDSLIQKSAAGGGTLPAVSTGGDSQ